MRVWGGLLDVPRRKYIMRRKREGVIYVTVAKMCWSKFTALDWDGYGYFSGTVIISVADHDASDFLIETESWIEH